MSGNSNPKKPIEEKRCLSCGSLMVRERKANGLYESYAVFNKRQYCSRQCSGKAHRKLRKALGSYRQEANRLRGSVCLRCGVTSRECNLNIHHADGDPTNNDIANLITLCLPCHNRIHAIRRAFKTYKAKGIHPLNIFFSADVVEEMGRSKHHNKYRLKRGRE